jgi:phosphate uptake regulator
LRSLAEEAVRVGEEKAAQAERLLEEAERQLSDPDLIERQLDEAQAAYERGEITEEAYLEIEEELLAWLIGQRGT